ncbi:MAG: GNAT family N-acetyltransferase [Oscillospiraceae bacterium]
MANQQYIDLFSSMHPDFFTRDSIRCLGDECFDEMILALEEFDESRYCKELSDEVSFGYYNGDFGEFLRAVKDVEKSWVDIFSREHEIYCGYIGGEIASFCIVENMGAHQFNGKSCRIGGPGCVGTVPKYRNRGIGLTMVKNVTQILKDEGYDYSYIHYTGVAQWYEKLGYKTILRWNGSGIMQL